MGVDDQVQGIEVDTLAPLARFLIDPTIYTDAAIFKAAYWFTGEFFVFLDRAPDGRISVELRPKADADMKTAASEFSNALIDARVRQIVLAETGGTRDELVQKAFQEGMPKPGFIGVRSNESAIELA